jgi:serine/threonine protein kinase
MTNNIFGGGGHSSGHGHSSSGHRSSRPSSAGATRASNGDHVKKRVIWTTEGIKTEYIHEKPRAPKEPSSSSAQHQPGYARPKSAGIGRSKSGHGLHKQQQYQQQQQQQHQEENIDQSYRSSNPYKERPVPNPVLSSSGNQGKSKKHTTSENEYVYSSNMYAKEKHSTQNKHNQQAEAAKVREGSGIDDSDAQSQGNQPGGSASSRIRAAINLGNQFQTHNNVVHEMAAMTKEKGVDKQAKEEAAAAAASKHASDEAAKSKARDQNAQDALNKKLQGLYTSRPNSANAASSGGNKENNKSQQQQPAVAKQNDQVIVLNKTQPAAGAMATTSVTSTSAGVGVERSGGLGTDHLELGADKGMQPSQSNTHPEISTPSASLELGDRSSMLINGGLSSDLRYGSSIEETGGAVVTDSSQLRLSTLPNQFCSLKEAEELQQLIISTCKSKGGGYSTTPTAGLSNSTALMDMYMVGKIVGVGSYGKVRAAWHRLTGQKVAIKTYDKSKLKDPEHWKRVQSEIKIMEQVSHPRIARMYEAVETPKRMHLIMECLDGGNLCSYVKSKRRLSEDESRRIFFQLVQALDVLHQSCVIHRDIKLENVLFDKNKEVKLIDFGFSTVSPNGKKLRVFCGTPSYMAPEIVRRTEYEGKPVDMWGLGVLLYALLCGCFPFRAKSYPDLYRRIARGTFTIPDELSSPVRDLLTQLLMVDPYARISAPNVLKHPWLQIQAANVPDMVKLQKDTPILISERPADDIDDGVINELAEFGIEKDDVVRQVMSKTHSSLATFYYLLLHTTKGGDKRLKSSSSSHRVERQRPQSSNAAGNGLVSGGADLTKKYAIPGGFTGYDGASGDTNQQSASGSASGNKSSRPRSASATRTHSSGHSSGHSAGGGGSSGGGSSGQNRHYTHRPRSASSGRTSGHRY